MERMLCVIIGACASVCVRRIVFVRACIGIYEYLFLCCVCACLRQASVPTSWQWAPDSRTFMTATLFPRMRQDNRVQIFDYRGELVCVVELQCVLLESCRKKYSFHCVL